MGNEGPTTGDHQQAPATAASATEASLAPAAGKRSRRILLGIAVVLLLAIAGLGISTLFVSNQYPTTQVATRSFTLPDEFAKVRGILVGTAATKQIIIVAGDNEFLEEKWEAIKLGVKGPQMNAKLKVRSRDDYIGRPEVHLTQVVTITPDDVLSDIDLAGKTERLWEYEMITHYLRDEESKNTRVELRLTQQIVTTVPWFLRWVADRRVTASAERQLVNQERAIRALIDGNRGKSNAAAKSASTAKSDKTADKSPPSTSTE